jgi:hypothetical protein
MSRQQPGKDSTQVSNHSGTKAMNLYFLVLLDSGCRRAKHLMLLFLQDMLATAAQLEHLAYFSSKRRILQR